MPFDISDIAPGKNINLMRPFISALTQVVPFRDTEFVHKFITVFFFKIKEQLNRIEPADNRHHVNHVLVASPSTAVVPI